MGDIDNDGVNDLVVTQGGLTTNSNYFRMKNKTLNLEIAKNYNRNTMRQNIMEQLKKSTNDNYLVEICYNNDCDTKTLSKASVYNYPFDEYFDKLLRDQEGPGSRVYVISSRTGKVLRILLVPENSETLTDSIYFKSSNQPLVIYGTGGKRKSGQLIAQNILTGDIFWSIKSKTKGFMGNPKLIYNKDNQPFVFAHTMDGDIMKVDATTGDVLWRQSIGNEYESMSNIALGYFNNDDSDDVIAIFNKGIWPKYKIISICIRW